MSFKRSFLLGTVFFRTTLPCSGGYHMERGGMPLHDAVGINSKKRRNYWKSRVRRQVYGLRGVSWWVCVCFIWLDMTTPPWCREKVMVYYYYRRCKISAPIIENEIFVPYKLSIALSKCCAVQPVMYNSGFSNLEEKVVKWPKFNCIRFCMPFS